MKYFLLLVGLCVGSALAAAIPEEERENGENGWYVPLIDGTFDWVDLEEAESYLESKQMMEGRLTINPVTFYLYTSSNPNEHHEIQLSRKSIEASPFNAKHPTRITIHGWTNNKDDFVNTGVRKAWLSHGDYNMIVVEWGRARSIDYVSSVVAVPGVGKKVAEMIDFLVKEFHLNLDTLEIIGHSLGAQVAGFTGKNMKSGKAHTIVGLDPALPLYNYRKPHKRLASTDAHYVESIQTNGGKLGFLKPIGKGAFYPNGGKKQPGCGVDITGSCSHGRAVTYYVEAVEKDDFASVKCGTYKEAVAKKCGSSYNSARMGAVTNAFMVEGEFYVPVNSKAPFGKLA